MTLFFCLILLPFSYLLLVTHSGFSTEVFLRDQEEVISHRIFWYTILLQPCPVGLEKNILAKMHLLKWADCNLSSLIFKN